MNILGIIPARGGSKGIKNKNIIDLAGRPLMSYAVKALKFSESVDKIVCTTDSEVIAKVANKYGAETPFLRPKELARDDSPTYPAIKHAVETLERNYGYKADYIVTAQPTYPLMQSEHIDAAVKKAISEKADSVITACELDHDCHPYNIRKVSKNGTTSFWKESEHYKFPTRQRKPKFYKFGNVFVSSYDTVVNKMRLEGEKNYSIVIDAVYSADINNPDDVSLIEILLNKIKPRF